MKLTFFGAAHEVTGSCTLLEAAGRRILIDCGMEQGADIYENCELPMAAGELDAVLLTHAHIDHSGKLPALVAQGFRGPIYATEAARRLCGIMLRDSAHIQEFEAEWRNRKAQRAGEPPYVPLYTMKDAEAALKQFCGCDYNAPVEIFPGVRVSFSDAGHLLACHSYSHDYLSLYASAESVLDEIHAWEEAVVKSGAALPEKICFRFPGGSTTYYMDKLRYEEIFWAITDAGYYAIDWTCANNDRYLNGMTEDQTLVEYLLESTVVTLNSLSWSPTIPKIMLMHDTADETVEALPQILDYLIAQGYTFGTLDELDGYWVFQ